MTRNLNLSAHTITVSGTDAMAFAHAQFSSRVAALAIGQWQFSAWLDSRGRVRALFHLARCSDDTLVLLLRGGDATATTEALRRFVFRAKVSITAAVPRQFSTGPALPLHTVSCDEQTLAFGCGDHSLRVNADDPEDMRWHQQQLRDGWPWLPAGALDRLLAPALSLQRLQAVVTDKGCYPGQEIVARLHFRGGGKNHLCLLDLSTEPTVDGPLNVAGRECGYVLDAACVDTHFEALATLDERTIESLSNGRLDVRESSPVIRLRNAWPS